MPGDDTLRRLNVLRKKARMAKKAAEAAVIAFFVATSAACEEIGEQIASNTLTERKVKESFKREIAMVDEDIVSLQAKRAKLQDTAEQTMEQVEKKRAELETKKAVFQALLLDNTDLPDSAVSSDTEAPASLDSTVLSDTEGPEASPASPAMTARTYQEEARGASPASTTRASSPDWSFEWPALPQDESRTPSPASTEDERERERERERTRACEND
jgi:hypothetical protein